MSDFRDPNDQFYGNSRYEPPNEAEIVGDGLSVLHSSSLCLVSLSDLDTSRPASHRMI
jgi:hypothetical protein